MYHPFGSVITISDIVLRIYIASGAYLLFFFEVGIRNASWDGGVSHTVPFSGHCDLDL